MQYVSTFLPLPAKKKGHGSDRPFGAVVYRNPLRRAGQAQPLRSAFAVCSAWLRFPAFLKHVAQRDDIVASVGDNGKTASRSVVTIGSAMRGLLHGVTRDTAPVIPRYTVRGDNWAIATDGIRFYIVGATERNWLLWHVEFRPEWKSRTNPRGMRVISTDVARILPR